MSKIYQLLRAYSEKTSYYPEMTIFCDFKYKFHLTIFNDFKISKSTLYEVS